MRKRLAMPETAALLQRRLDVRVRVEHTLTPEELDVLVEVPARPDGGIDFEAVANTGIEVVCAVARRSMNGPSTGVERDVFAEDADRIAVVERMAEADAFELPPLHLRDRLREIASHDGSNGRREFLGDDHRPAVDVERCVV